MSLIRADVKDTFQNGAEPFRLPYSLLTSARVHPICAAHGKAADYDYHHYDLGFPGAVGRDLNRSQRHPVGGGAVSTFEFTTLRAPPFAVRVHLA